MTNGLHTFREKAALLREQGIVFCQAADALDRFVAAANTGDLDGLKKEAAATQALQQRLEKLAGVANIFRFEVRL